MKKKIVILESKGSKGENTFKIIKKNKKKFEIILLSTNTNIRKVFTQAKVFNVKNVLVNDYKKFIIAKSKYKNSKIDFLDIDVEGADLKVLEGLSFDKFKPELVCVEIHAKEIKQSDIYKFLADKNYELLWSGVFSHIFKRLEN